MNKKNIIFNIALTLSVILIYSIAVSTIITRRPLSVAIKTTDHSKISVKRFIAIPGQYKLALVIDRKKYSYDFLNSIFGEFACWIINEEHPCGEYQNYQIKWSIENRQHKLSGLKSEKIRNKGGWISKEEYAMGLAVVNLKFGFNKINIEIIDGLSCLNINASSIVLSPGVGAKDSQNEVANLFLIISVISSYILLPLAIVFWLLWIRNFSFKK